MRVLVVVTVLLLLGGFARAEADDVRSPVWHACPGYGTPSTTGACDPDQNVGTILYTPGRPIIAMVMLNGHTTARLLLDTGASTTLVHPTLLAAAGVDLSRPVSRGEMVSVTGRVTMFYFTVDIEVAGHRVQVPRVAAYRQPDNSDGLLGRDFLDRFKVTVDPAAGTVTLVPK